YSHYGAAHLDHGCFPTRRSSDLPRRRGWQEALIVEFPERLKRVDRRVGRELYDFLPEDTRNLAAYFEPFIRGLPWRTVSSFSRRSEDHTSELQSPDHLVFRLLRE